MSTIFANLFPCLNACLLPVYLTFSPTNIPLHFCETCTHFEPVIAVSIIMENVTLENKMFLFRQTIKNLSMFQKYRIFKLGCCDVKNSAKMLRFQVARNRVRTQDPLEPEIIWC